jgi:hypothetical protein
VLENIVHFHSKCLQDIFLWYFTFTRRSGQDIKCFVGTLLLHLYVPEEGSSRILGKLDTYSKKQHSVTSQNTVI